MADNIQVTPGSGADPKAATDERVIGAETVHIQRVIDAAASNAAANDIVATTTATERIAANPTRKSVTVIAATANTGPFYVGFDNTVDASLPANGVRIDPGAGATFETTKAIWLDSPSGTQTAYYWEEYD